MAARRAEPSVRFLTASVAANGLLALLVVGGALSLWRDPAHVLKGAGVKPIPAVFRDKPKLVRWLEYPAAGLSLAGLSFALASHGSFRRNRRRWRAEQGAQQQTFLRAQEELLQARQSLDSKTIELAQLSELNSTLEKEVLRSSEKMDRQLLLLERSIEAANDVMMIAEADPTMPRVIRVNRAFERMTGYARYEIEGRSPKMLQGPKTDPATVADIRSHLDAHQPVQAELLNYRKDGTEFWVELNIQPVFNDTGELIYWISIQRDITERKKAEEKIWWQANYDALTGLPNRFFYQERLAAAIERAEKEGTAVGVLFFDLDRFKQINDSLGHLLGDQLLQDVAGRLKERLRGGDIIARVGGDEFTILLPTISSEKQAAVVAQKLLDALDAPFFIEGHELFVTASIGISMAPQDGRDITTLLRNADVAMYRAKEQGRDSYRVYNETMNARTLDRLVLETHLRRALERDEFILLYQPQINLRTGEVIGVEALLRWENPHLGRVSPAQFIPIAEETGLIIEIGDWVLREACQQAAYWQRNGRFYRMSVNLSARQFELKDLPERVAQALSASQMAPQYLDLELTETTLLRGLSAAESLQRLKDRGVRLSVDDFGTGYSSLSYLRHFPLDVLKIDRSFVQGLAEDRKSEAVVRALIELAHGVGLEVIAEGVETEMQRTALVAMNCDAMQGYLVSAPTTARELEAIADRGLRPLASETARASRARVSLKKAA
jgi:diguanylate cyclase (GGDEF)-like protein/PAS domain S-box-containing protein